MILGSTICIGRGGVGKEGEEKDTHGNLCREVK